MEELAENEASVQAERMLSRIGISLSDSLRAAQVYWACHALNFTATRAKCQNAKLRTRRGTYGRSPPNQLLILLPFLKPAREKRKLSNNNKLEPQVVPSFYAGLPQNNPSDSMRVIFSSGNMFDSSDITWASIPSPALISTTKSEQGVRETAELQEVASVEVESNASHTESNKVQSDRPGGRWA